MSEWQDEKIQRVALWYIGKHSMDVEEWRYTRLGKFHSEVKDEIGPEQGELAIVSCFISGSSWYAFSTRRIVGLYNDIRTDKPALERVKSDYGNFKGFGNKTTEIAALGFKDGTEARLEFEAGKASMAPIYAEMFWNIKFPVLDVFKD